MVECTNGERGGEDNRTNILPEYASDCKRNYDTISWLQFPMVVINTNKFINVTVEKGEGNKEKNIHKFQSYTKMIDITVL